MNTTTSVGDVKSEFTKLNTCSSLVARLKDIFETFENFLPFSFFVVRIRRGNPGNPLCKRLLSFLLKVKVPEKELKRFRYF